MTTLYFCYQSLLDPLTQTQVLAYLEGLARAGYRPILVTFEPTRLRASEREEWNERLRNLGVIWRQLRYHKWPTVPATALDIACGFALGLWCITRHGVALVHARSHVAGVMAAGLRVLTGVPYLFDIRGFLAEEYADAGVWPVDGRLYRMTKRLERSLIAMSSGVVVLTERAAALLRAWYPRELAAKPLMVIPCCVDLRRAPARPRAHEVAARQCDQNASLVYVGKLGGWYPTRAMVELFAVARHALPGLRWTVLTQSDATELRSHFATGDLDTLITIRRAEPGNLLDALAKSSAGICLYRRDRSAAGCSPTKIAEYLAAGLPVVASSGIGDVDQVLHGAGKRPAVWTDIDSGPVGVLVDERDPDDLARAARELIQLLREPDIRARCRAVAAACFDLETIGWPRYHAMYQVLISRTT